MRSDAPTGSRVPASPAVNGKETIMISRPRPAIYEAWAINSCRRMSLIALCWFPTPIPAKRQTRTAVRIMGPPSS